MTSKFQEALDARNAAHDHWKQTVKQIPKYTGAGRAKVEVVEEGLRICNVFSLSPEEAVLFARWILDTFDVPAEEEPTP